MDLILGFFDYIFFFLKNYCYYYFRKLEEGNLNYGGDVIFWDILFGIFYLLKGEMFSDDIGIVNIFNYLQIFVGLMFVFFIYGQFKCEVNDLVEGFESDFLIFFIQR